MADDIIESIALLELLSQRAVFTEERLLLQATLHDEADFIV